MVNEPTERMELNQDLQRQLASAENRLTGVQRRYYAAKAEMEKAKREMDEVKAEVEGLQRMLRGERKERTVVVTYIETEKPPTTIRVPVTYVKDERPEHRKYIEIKVKEGRRDVSG